MRFESQEKLSAHMRRIRKTDTKPEMLVRKMLHRMGYRYRLHRRDLPGTPDIVISGGKIVVFVHGCFWHQHDCRLGGKIPSTNSAYWKKKLERNKERDEEAQRSLTKDGWRVVVIWECETRQPELASRLQEFLA